MAFFRDMKQTLTNGAKDMAKLSKLKAEDTAEELKHEVRKEQMHNTVDDLQDGYEKLKETVKDVFK